jgi:predicted N-acyltransferase
MKIKFINDDMTHAIITRRSPESRWWRPHYETAEVIRRLNSYADSRAWIFVTGGDYVFDHAWSLANALERKHKYLLEKRKFRSPWTAATPLPRAKALKT